MTDSSADKTMPPTTPEKWDSPLDICDCGHPRSDHADHIHCCDHVEIEADEDGGECPCLEFTLEGSHAD